MELTERLELSTSPLPRECSTTELRQPLKLNLTILPRTQPAKHYTEGKKRKQEETQIAKLARLHRPERTGSDQTDQQECNYHPTAARRA